MSCLETLKQRGLKLTPQRRLIVDFIDNTETHLTAEDIITYVQSKMPEVNKSTVYRILELLEETGDVLKSTSSDRFIYHRAKLRLRLKIWPIQEEYIFNQEYDWLV